MRILLLVAAAYHLALGVLQATAPQSFYDDFATFGPYNDHFVRDVASFYLAFGAGLLVAAARPSWRAPVLTIIVVQYALHVVNHVVDIADPEKGWQGPFTAVSLAAIGAGLWWLLRRASTPSSAARTRRD